MKERGRFSNSHFSIITPLTPQKEEALKSIGEEAAESNQHENLDTLFEIPHAFPP